MILKRNVISQKCNVNFKKRIVTSQKREIKSQKRSAQHKNKEQNNILRSKTNPHPLSDFYSYA